MGPRERVARDRPDRLTVDGDDASLGPVQVEGARGGRAVASHDAAGWIAPACRTRCRLRYTVDLEALGSSCQRLDCGRRIGDAVVSQASAWMLRPEPAGEAVVRVRMRPEAGDRYATGLRVDPSGGYVFRSEDLGEASYTAFGAFRRRSIPVGGARIDVVLLGAPIAMGDDAVADWVKGAAERVASLYGRFPVDATVFVVPVPGADEVVFGRVMSLTGASVVLLFGDQARPADAHSDWVVMHELFHLSSPSFVGEGHWLEEGLATYYEPVLRARAGWISEAFLWGDFVAQMPRGLRKGGEPASLEDRDDIDATYWGGALFALLADVRIRTATRAAARAESFDDVLRAVLATRGDATHRASVADFLDTAASSTGGPWVRQVYDSWALRGEGVDLDALWKSLGVARVGGVTTLRDDAPLAQIRKGIAGLTH